MTPHFSTPELFPTYLPTVIMKCKPMSKPGRQTIFQVGQSLSGQGTEQTEALAPSR